MDHEVAEPRHRRRFRPRRLVLLILALVPLAYAAYLLMNVWWVQARIQERMPDAANAVFTPDGERASPDIVFPTAVSAPVEVGASQTPAASSTPSPVGATPASAASTGVPEATTPPGPTASVPPVATGTPGAVDVPISQLNDWYGKKRINVLLLGIDARGGEAITRPDTIILASLDFENDRAHVLSLPRDLFVYVPEGFGWQKLNTAYAIGDNPEHPERVWEFGGGVGLLIRTLRYNFTIDSIDAYGRVNFEAFVRGVDALGGIEVCLPKALVDDRYPERMGWKRTTVRFERGCQRMDGERALQYARIRYVDNDFGRMKRQQQVIAAIQQKARDPAVILRAPALLGAVGESDNVRTTLNLPEQIRLAEWAASLPRENIEFLSITGRIGTSRKGESVVFADKEEVDRIIQRVFGPEAELRTYD